VRPESSTILYVAARHLLPFAKHFLYRYARGRHPFWWMSQHRPLESRATFIPGFQIGCGRELLPAVYLTGDPVLPTPFRLCKGRRWILLGPGICFPLRNGCNSRLTQSNVFVQTREVVSFPVGSTSAANQGQSSSPNPTNGQHGSGENLSTFCRPAYSGIDSGSDRVTISDNLRKTVQVNFPPIHFAAGLDWSRIAHFQGIVTSPKAFLAPGLIAGYRGSGESPSPGGFCMLFWTADAAPDVTGAKCRKRCSHCPPNERSIFLRNTTSRDGKDPRHEVSQRRRFPGMVSKDYP